MTTRKKPRKPRVTAKQRAALPEIPAEVWSPYGPIPVVQVPDLKSDDGESCFGLWNPLDRIISIRQGMKLEVAWLTLWHERTHADLEEIGVRLTEDQVESVCNRIAESRVQEMLAR
jgi:hypothetical protein